MIALCEVRLDLGLPKSLFIVLCDDRLEARKGPAAHRKKWGTTANVAHCGHIGANLLRGQVRSRTLVAGHECQRETPVCWPATLHSRWGAPGEDQVRLHQENGQARVTSRHTLPGTAVEQGPLSRRRGQKCLHHGLLKLVRSTPVRLRIPPPEPGRCRSTRRRRMSSPVPRVPQHASR